MEDIAQYGAVLEEPKTGEGGKTMNIAVAVLLLAVFAAALVVTGVAMLLGLPSALIAAGLFIFGAALRLQKVMAPRG
jgi:hypothetical protein